MSERSEDPDSAVKRNVSGDGWSGGVLDKWMVDKWTIWLRENQFSPVLSFWENQ